ncbi:hypothetical protein PIB30_070877 [Stylosanthes scabra]|uniref:Uncharacterized protein n=1 Tax=Stylosanthes scabra TaxID=79078 RepID=A0ABU6RNL3_9FABA|nr:hypothetical protein [Stylosanthes scabra]
MKTTRMFTCGKNRRLPCSEWRKWDQIIYHFRIRENEPYYALPRELSAKIARDDVSRLWFVDNADNCVRMRLWREGADSFLSGKDVNELMKLSTNKIDVGMQLQYLNRRVFSAEILTMDLVPLEPFPVTSTFMKSMVSEKLIRPRLELRQHGVRERHPEPLARLGVLEQQDGDFTTLGASQNHHEPAEQQDQWHHDYGQMIHIMDGSLAGVQDIQDYNFDDFPIILYISEVFLRWWMNKWCFRTTHLDVLEESVTTMEDKTQQRELPPIGFETPTLTQMMMMDNYQPTIFNEID